MKKDDKIPSSVEVNAVVVEADIGERIVVGASHFAGSRPPLGGKEQGERRRDVMTQNKRTWTRTKLVLLPPRRAHRDTSSATMIRG